MTSRVACVRLLLAWLLSAASVAAEGRREASEPERVLTLERALAAAERSHPAIFAAELERAVADGELESARGGFDVSLKARGTVTPLGYYDSVRLDTVLEQATPWWGASAFAGWRLGTGEFPVYDERQQTLGQGELRAGVQLPLWRNGPIDRRRANLERAELGPELADLSLAGQRIGLRRAVAQRYWAWVAAGRRLVIAQTLLDNVEQRDAAVARRVSSGDLPPIERLENLRALEQRRASLVRAQRELEQAAIELGLFARDERGLPRPPTPAQLPRAFPEVQPGAWRDAQSDALLALSRRPELRRLELQLRQQRVELAWARNQRAPGVDLQLAVSKDLGPRLAARPDLSETVLEASVLLDVPLQTRQIDGRIRAAVATLQRLEAQAQLARERIEADVRDARSAVSAAAARLDATRRELGLARELEAAERLRFEQGDGTLLLVNLREQQTAETEQREVEALTDHFRALADLQAARGD